MATKHTFICGDSRNMARVPDQGVQLVVTSPPCWQLKDYGSPNQIGFNDTYEQYINNLNLVWQECYRVLENGCRLCINIGDQFARSVYYGRYKIIPIRTEIIKFCETIGFDYMEAIIWQKVTTCNTTGGATIMGSFPCPRNGILKIDYEFILLFKKPGKPKTVSGKVKEASRLTAEEWNQYFSGHWNFAGEPQDKHLAMFPVSFGSRIDKNTAARDDYFTVREIELHLPVEPAPDKRDRLYNVDFFIKVNQSYIGLQIKPVCDASQITQIYKERSLHKNTHERFTKEFGGRVFYVFSQKAGNKKVIRNPEVIREIQQEIEKLQTQP